MPAHDPYAIYAVERARQISRESPEHKRLMDEAKAEFEALLMRDKERSKNNPAFPIRKDRRKSEG